MFVRCAFGGGELGWGVSALEAERVCGGLAGRACACASSGTAMWSEGLNGLVPLCPVSGKVEYWHRYTLSAFIQGFLVYKMPVYIRCTARRLQELYPNPTTNASIAHARTLQIAENPCPQILSPSPSKTPYQHMAKKPPRLTKLLTPCSTPNLLFNASISLLCGPSS